MAVISVDEKGTVTPLREFISEFVYSQTPVPTKRKYTRFNRKTFRLRPEYRQLTAGGRINLQENTGVEMINDIVMKNKPVEFENKPLVETPVVHQYVKSGVNLPENQMNTYELKHKIPNSLSEETQKKTVEKAKASGIEVAHIGGRLVFREWKIK